MSEPRADRPHMPDYGVDTPDWDPLPWSWAAAKLAGNRNFWVVTVSANGRPHALPVWAVWDDDEHRLAFSCGPSSRKAANLAANPRVVVALDDTVECVSVEGRAAVVADDARRDTWIDRYLTKYVPMAPDLSAEFLRANLVVEFVPERAFAIIEREDEFSTRATRWTFDSPPAADG
jgi:PPOX class probable F420-dependent enzyme